jgi:polysaccharide biosynthesis protein PslG
LAWIRRLAAAVLVLCIALPGVQSAASAKKRHPHKPGHPSSRQLRGAMVTPNWSIESSLFAITPEQQRAEIADVAAMGGRLIRFHVDWSQLVPNLFAGVDQSYQARVDQVMAWAASYRIKVILNLVGTPCWAPASGPNCPLTHDVMFSPPRPDFFQATTKYLLQRYPGVFAFEVWNEPNLGSAFWVGSPAEFAATVNAAVAGAEEAGVGTKVLAAGLAMDGSGYLQQLYDAGMRGQDGISLHPYSMSSGVWVDPSPRGSPFRRAIENTHRVMVRNHDHGGLWLTEFGFATCPAQPHCLSDSRAATWLAKSYRVAARYRYVKGLTAFSMRDYADPQDRNPAWDLRSGILQNDLSRKPAFRQVKNALRRLR